MKKFARSTIIAFLGWQVRRLRKNHDFKVIAVAGSIGKTSTKYAVASVLGQKFKVGFQKGNYNDAVSVPLIFFGRFMPSLFNPLAWLKIFIQNEISLKRKYPFDFILVELGTDGPGQIAEFERYLKADLAILTAITMEHMENFKGLDDVAEEELGVVKFSGKSYINTDLCDKKYLDKIPAGYLTYGNKDGSDFQLTDVKYQKGVYSFSITSKGQIILKASSGVVSTAQLFSICAAVAAGHHFGLDKKQLEAGVKSIVSVSGRMQILDGINGSVIIDDTYNASPAAVKQALDTLYNFERSHKVALLGSMNELGRFSAEEHKAIGEYCDPKQLELLVTVGAEANKYIAEAAAKNGCKTKTFDNPYQAGDYLRQTIKSDTVILAKGSQNGIFTEEAVKRILAKPEDSSKLVRQSSDWLAKKQKQFGGAKT